MLAAGWLWRKGSGSELCLGTSGSNSSLGAKGTVGLWRAPANARVLWQGALGASSSLSALHFGLRAGVC